MPRVRRPPRPQNSACLVRAKHDFSAFPPPPSVYSPLPHELVLIRAGTLGVYIRPTYDDPVTHVIQFESGTNTIVSVEAHENHFEYIS